MWYNTYFLIVQDFINRSKNNDIAVGPWRWSVAWSLMAYMIGITDVDPFPYDLLFERFLNPARVSMPDIDVDFEDTKRDKVVEYVARKYGEDKVAHVGTYMTMAARAAFKDVARTMGIPFDRSNFIASLINEKTIQASINATEDLRNMHENDPVIRKTFDEAIKLEWTVRWTWVHACGIIIAPESITCYSPVQHPPKPQWKVNAEEVHKELVTQYEWHDLEDIGLLKMDFLGLRTLTLIKNAMKIVRAKYRKANKKLPKLFEEYFETMVFTPPLDDKNTFERVLQKWDTSWVFQFEWDGIRNFLVKLKPTDVNDIIAMGALYRPGPMEFIPRYIDRKHGKEEKEYMLKDLRETLVSQYGEDVALDEKRKLFEDLDPILGLTYGIAVYQEQLMFLVQAMAWFSLAEADNLRRGIGKKIKEVIEQIKWQFIEKAASFREYKEETSRWVYEKMIEPAAFYSFNKSHSVTYGMLSYQTAYLKANYPIEFNAALLRSVEEDTDKLSKFINELKLQGYKVLPPHINESFTHVAALDDTIRLWFQCIKGVWFDVSEFIEQERTKNGPYTSLEDFLTRCQSIINKKTLESLAKAWAFNGFADRKTVLHNISRIIDRTKMANAESSANSLFAMAAVKPALQLDKTDESTKMERLLTEYEVFKTFVSWHPFDGLYPFIKWQFSLISMFKNYDKEQAFGNVKILCYVKNIQRAKKKWFFMAVEDISDEIEIFMKETLDIQKFDILVIEGRKNKSLKVSKIVKTSLERIVEDAKKSGKYNDETVSEVKITRLWMNALSMSKDIEDEMIDTETGEVIKIENMEEIPDGLSEEDTTGEWDENNASDHNNNWMTQDQKWDQNNNAWNNDGYVWSAGMPEEVVWPMHFALPDNPSLLQSIAQVIREHPWEHQVTIWTIERQLNPTGIERLRALLY
jgi:DNA polymerase III subunit alpha